MTVLSHFHNRLERLTLITILTRARAVDPELALAIASEVLVCIPRAHYLRFQLTNRHPAPRLLTRSTAYRYVVPEHAATSHSHHKTEQFHLFSPSSYTASHHP